MTRDSGSERPQRTVAELLAEYGGAQGDAPRRRRRRAEDDGDSAPQTIIERVLSDSGKLLPIRDDQPPGAPQAAPPGQPRRPGGHRSGDRRPAAAPQPAPQQPQPSQPLPVPPPTAYAEPVRRPVPNRPVQQPPQQPHVQPQQQQPPPQQPAPQFPPSRPAMPPAGGSTQSARPAAGPPSRTAMRPVNRNPAGPPTMQSRPPARPPVDDELATAVHPPLPDFAPQPPQQQPQQQQGQPQQQPPTVLTPPVQQRPSVLPRDATTEEFPPVPSEQQAPAPPQQTAGQQTRRHPPAPAPMESTQAHAGPYVDDYDDEDEYGAPAGTRDDEHDPFPRREDFDDVDDDAPAGGREWFLMAGQVGAGAIAGAAVWLAFSWLWGFQPVLAVIAALIVIVGLVLGVRRWRRAEDLQTTVLAILAGLVVTVSPAALLLLHR